MLETRHGLKQDRRWAGLLSEALLVSPWPARFFRIGLGVVFVWAGAVKLYAPRAFARTISGYGLVPDELLVPVAIGLPAIEFVAGVGLLLNRRWSFGLVSGLLLMFIAVLGFGIWGELDVDCGCFSQAELDARLGLRIALARDIAMLAVVGYLIFWRRHRAHLDRVLVTGGNNNS